MYPFHGRRKGFPHTENGCGAAGCDCVKNVAETMFLP